MILKSLQIHGKNVSLSHLGLQKIPSVLPPINFINDLEIRNTSTPVILKLNDMNFISKSIENIKIIENSTLESLDPVDIFKDIDTHHRVSYGLFLIIFITGFIVVIILYCRPKSNVSSSGPAVTVNVPSSTTSTTRIELPKHNFNSEESTF